MLVLSRQRDETVMIGDDIEVTAPKEISVHRKEVYDAIRRENRAAAQVKPEDLAGLGKISAPPPADPTPPAKRDPYVPGRGCRR